MPKPRGRPFQPGNTLGAGRPKGSLNKSTLAAQELFAFNATEVTQKCLDMAKSGDPTAMRLIMDRIHPVRKDLPVRWTVPVIRSRKDSITAYQNLLSAVADGELTPGEAHQILPLLQRVSGVVLHQPILPVYPIRRPPAEPIKEEESDGPSEDDGLEEFEEFMDDRT